MDITLPDFPDKINAFIASKSLLAKNDGIVYLEYLDITAKKENIADNIAKDIAGSVFGKVYPFGDQEA